ncbi:major facilitator superfamily domain-containing protein [Trichoderma ceciliae]
MTPLTVKILGYNLRLAFVMTSVLLIVGNWVRYVGSISATHQSGGIYAVGVGQALLGAAQSLVLSSPTEFAEVWFSPSTRVIATSIMTLSNPLGAALGQVVTPFWLQSVGDISSMVLYVSILSSAVAIPGFFIQNRPPTPPSSTPSSAPLSMRVSLRILVTSLECCIIIIPFWILVALFLSMSSLISQIVGPYGISDTDSGIGGGLLILSGLLASAIVSPIIDRTKQFLITTKVAVLIIASCYVAFIWVAPLGNVAGLYALLCVLGAASLASVPVVLEMLGEISYPVGPEVTSTICWAGGQLLGGCLILIADAMEAGEDATPPENMRTYLIFQAALAVAVVPFSLSLGLFGRQQKMELKRTQAEKKDAGSSTLEATAEESV